MGTSSDARQQPWDFTVANQAPFAWKFPPNETSRQRPHASPRAKLADVEIGLDLMTRGLRCQHVFRDELSWFCWAASR